MDINQYKHGLVIGDMNVDLLKFGSHPKTDDYLNNNFYFVFLPVITKPTERTPLSVNLNDHIQINKLYSHSDASIIVTDVADHFGAFYAHKLKSTSTPKDSQKQIGYYLETNINRFKHYL